MAPMPPAITAGTGPISAPRKPDSASPSSFEAEMNSDDTAPTRPRISIRRVELDQRLADIDREHVRRAEQSEARERQRHRAGQAEDDRRAAEHRDRGEHLDADVVLERPHREEGGGERRADRRRGAQMAEALGAGVEHVAREDGKHRRRAAEQHREQIEADRAEDEPVAADVAQALDHLRPRVGPARNLGPRDRPDREQADERDGEQDPALAA